MSANPEIKSRRVIQRYVTLPWERRSRAVDVALGHAHETGVLLEVAEIDIYLDDLFALAEDHAPTSPFSSRQESALIDAGWLVRRFGDDEGTDALRSWLKANA